MGEKITPSVVLEDTIPISDRFARTPRHYMIRGLFFEPFFRTLGEEWHAIEKDLVAMPEGGRYAVFTEYPQIDHARFAVAAAAKQFPDLPEREGLRRIERSAAAQFEASSMGKILTALVTDPASAFRVLPSVYVHVQTGGRLQSVIGTSGARVEVRDFAPWVDCSLIGALEGIVVLLGKRPSITLELLNERDANYDIEWS